MFDIRDHGGTFSSTIKPFTTVAPLQTIYKNINPYRSNVTDVITIVCTMVVNKKGTVKITATGNGYVEIDKNGAFNKQLINQVGSNITASYDMALLKGDELKIKFCSSSSGVTCGLYSVTIQANNTDFNIIY